MVEIVIKMYSSEIWIKLNKKLKLKIEVRVINNEEKKKKEERRMMMVESRFGKRKT